MDERLAKFRTPEDCEQFAINVQARLPDVAQAARRKAVELRAASFGAETVAEREAVAAVYAYERVMSERKGKKFRASRTWQMIERLGVIEAVERVVTRPADALGFTALAEMGMLDFAFESVVVRYPDLFSSAAATRSAERLQSWRDAVQGSSAADENRSHGGEMGAR